MLDHQEKVGKKRENVERGKENSAESHLKKLTFEKKKIRTKEENIEIEHLTILSEFQ